MGPRGLKVEPGGLFVVVEARERVDVKRWVEATTVGVEAWVIVLDFRVLPLVIDEVLGGRDTTQDGSGELSNRVSESVGASSGSLFWGADGLLLCGTSHRRDLEVGLGSCTGLISALCGVRDGPSGSISGGEQSVSLLGLAGSQNRVAHGVDHGWDLRACVERSAGLTSALSGVFHDLVGFFGGGRLAAGHDVVDGYRGEFVRESVQKINYLSDVIGVERILVLQTLVKVVDGWVFFWSSPGRRLSHQCCER
jgi:hypothetical protein